MDELFRALLDALMTGRLSALPLVDDETIEGADMAGGGGRPPDAPTDEAGAVAEMAEGEASA